MAMDDEEDSFFFVHVSRSIVQVSYGIQVMTFLQFVISAIATSRETFGETYCPPPPLTVVQEHETLHVGPPRLGLDPG